MSNGDVIMMHHGMSLCILQLFCVGVVITIQDQSARVRQYLPYAMSMSMITQPSLSPRPNPAWNTQYRGSETVLNQ